MTYISIWDIVLLPLYLLVIYILAYWKKNKHIANMPVYKYYVPGLFVKIIGGIGVCIIYVYYYGGGDTTNYFRGGVAMINLLFKSPSDYFRIMMGNYTINDFFLFDNHMMPYYMFRDPQAVTVIKLISVIALFGVKKFVLTTVLIAWITYGGIWRLFLFFNRLFPEIPKGLALSILFIPSVFFWGSGILKDSFTLAATAWLIYSFYNVYENKKIIWFTFTTIISVFILISIKPYIFFSILIASLVTLTYRYLLQIKGYFLKLIMIPIITIVIWGGGSLLIVQVGSYVGGSYQSVDLMLEKAKITQIDLKRDAYGDNSFNVGEFDATLPSIASKMPQAIIAGLFRPFIWECQNSVMFLSGLENLIILMLCFYIAFMLLIVAFRVGLGYMFKIIFNSSIVVFTLFFSIMFAFSIGLSTANFGALVRYKIPMIPFFLSSIFIIIHKLKCEKIYKKFFLNRSA